MTELAATIREALAALAESDPSLKRFGAAHHRYELAPVTVTTPYTVPADLETFVMAVGSSGAGPGYGFLGLREPVAAPDRPWHHAIPVAHLGCGYAAVVPSDGDHRGEVWLDARGVGVVRPLAETFTAFYLDWIDRLANNRWPESPVGPGLCPLPNALGGFLGIQERRLGREPGSLYGEELETALAQLGPQSIEIAAESSLLFPDGVRVDPCVSCARLVENLVPDGLAADVLAPGSAPSLPG